MPMDKQARRVRGTNPVVLIVKKSGLLAED
jgi:hypothetical protein